MIPERPPDPTAEAGRDTGPRLRELLLLCAVMGGLAWAGARATMTLRYDRSAIAAGEVWRLYTAHLVHLSAGHWLMNMTGLVGLGWLYAPLASRAQWTALVLFAAGFIGVALYVASPEVDWYVGLSGVLHAIWAAAGVAIWRRSRTESVAALGLLAAKLAYEWHAGPLSAGGPDALPVVTVAHRYGALAGLAFAAAMRWWRKPL